MTRILCYGDSNTWGASGDEPSTGVRHPRDVRWPCVMADMLDAELVEEGLNGRTTDAADLTHPEVGGAGLDGAAYLPACLASHLPLDLVVVMLGTNDLKAMFARSPLRIALGAGRLVDIVQGIGGGIGTAYASPRVLLVCPPRLVPMQGFAEMFAGGHAKSEALPALYGALAGMAGAGFLDANTVVATDGADGLHFTGATQRALGRGVADAVRRFGVG